MKRAYSIRDIESKRWQTLPWGDRWSRPFGFPADNARWFVSGASASGKSSFVMQLSKELCKYGAVLYCSYEEGVSQSFQRRLEYLHMSEVRGRFRVVTGDSLDELAARLRKPKSANAVVIDSFQVTGWSYEEAVGLMEAFPRKCFVWVSQEYKSQPLGKPAMRLKYICDMKVRVTGYRAYCQGRAIGEAGSSFTVWEEGIIKTSNIIGGL